MERSMFGSAIKTYQGKRNRFSSYRPSALNLIFKDTDDIFDKLVEDEVKRQPLPVKKSTVKKGVVRHRSYHPGNPKISTLKSIQNYSCSYRKKSTVPTRTKSRKVRTKNSRNGKENTLKCSSRLYMSNSDSDNGLGGLTIYDLSPAKNPLVDRNKRNTLKKTKPKSKRNPKSSFIPIEADTKVLNRRSSQLIKSPLGNLNRSSSTDDIYPRKTILCKREKSVFKKPTIFVEGSSDLFYKNNVNKNQGQTKTRKKLFFFDGSNANENAWETDDSLENKNNFFPRVRGHTERLHTSRSIIEIFNSDDEAKNNCESFLSFNPRVVSTPGSKSSTSKSEVTKLERLSKNAELSKKLDETFSPSYRVTNSFDSVIALGRSPDNRNESLIRDLRSTINEDAQAKISRSLDSSFQSCYEGSCSENQSASLSLCSDSENENLNLSSRLENSKRSVLNSTPHEEHSFLEKTDESDLRDDPNVINNDLKSHSSLLFPVSFPSSFRTNESLSERCQNDITSTSVARSIHKTEDESKQIQSEANTSEEILIDDKSATNSTRLTEIFESCTIEDNSKLVDSICLENRLFVSCRSTEITENFSQLRVTTQPDDISETENFKGWSNEEYLQASESKESFEKILQQFDASEPSAPEEEMPPHLKLVTRRRKKTIMMPTLNEENSLLEEENLLCAMNNIPPPCQYFGRPSVNDSRYLERSSMLRPTIYLAAGKKWRRSFITLKNIRDYGFQSQIEREDFKGRCWRKNVEELVCSQFGENVEFKEIEDGGLIKNASNETFFNSNYTLLEKCNRPSKARFSLCINQSGRSRQRIDDGVKEATETSDGASGTSRDTTNCSKLLSDKSYFSFVCSQPESKNIESCYDLEAGDYSRTTCKVSLERYDIQDHFSAKEVVLRYCKQTEPLPFERCFDDRLLKNCRKIGEGVYGEVFMLKRNRAQCSVLKIIPIEGETLINGEKQKKFEEIVSELIISIELSNLRKRRDYYAVNFAELQKCWCVYGEYPKRLIDLWNEYNDVKGSDNDSPKVFADNQLYIILELSHGGEDVESFVFNNAQQTLSVFTQVTYALAVAERAFMFEHRDLHWGNVLVSKCKEEKIKYIIDDQEFIVKLRGVKVTIIDYTLSRISIDNCVVYNDIGQDPDLFTAQGDFQFEVYRLMRDEVRNIWNQFVPKTNVYWLYYLLDKMVNEVRYKRISTQIHRTNFKRLKELHESILVFLSCFELSCDEYFKRFIVSR